MNNVRLSGLLIFFFILVVSISFRQADHVHFAAIAGAWHATGGGNEQVLVFTDNYFTYTVYDKIKKEFSSSLGGTYQVQNNNVKTTIEFNSQDKEKVGQSGNYSFSISSDNLTSDITGSESTWKRIDDGTGPLAGTWRISGRMQNDKMNPMDGGPRKTLKILSGSRFQWVAMNAETKEFFGTGGGTYSFVNGKYTETIEFFSRDSSRIGVSLSFDGKVENNEWHHSGTSSRGAKIHEVWTRVK